MGGGGGGGGVGWIYVLQKALFQCISHKLFQSKLPTKGELGPCQPSSSYLLQINIFDIPLID